MNEDASALTHRRWSLNVLNRLIEEAPGEPARLSDDHRRSLAARFRAVPGTEHRRLDAWMVERAGRASEPFRWSSATARRAVGNAALRRTHLNPALTRLEAVEAEITDQLVRYAGGYARAGSLAWFLATCSPGALGLVRAEAANWATQLAEAAQSLSHPWSLADTDAYYDVARARTTLRGRRDLIVTGERRRVLIRVRAGAPGKCAGPGLRADLTIDALAHPEGECSARIIGLWPEAGVVLSVDGAMGDLRAGARDLVRTAVAMTRRSLPRAA